ncbi:hypothetical protein ACJ41O_003465 [Fusarium nematophilum]
MTRGWALILRGFVAGVNADDDGLSDFSNSLATDLAPLPALFIGAMTKQYLSENTSFHDYLIFATGPIGILTAIMSTIRGEGAVEAELYASTSRDLCEVFGRGGIARVLGRPRILERVYDPDEASNPDSARPWRFAMFTDSAGLNLSRNFFSAASGRGPHSGWRRIKGTILE